MVQRKGSIRILFLVVLLVGVSACTKKEETSKVSIQLPFKSASSSSTLTSSSNRSLSAGEIQKFAEMTFQNLGRVMVVVTGTNPYFYVWDKHDSSGEALMVHTLTIPRSPEVRKVRVLAVFETSEGMIFAYGENGSAVINSEIVDLPITVRPIGQSLGEGGISGRILSGPDSGPTGPVDMLFMTPDGTPMKVSETGIYGGWFSFFAVQGGSFKYVLRDGTSLFDAFDASAPQSKLNGDKVLWVKGPGAYRSNSTSEFVLAQSLLFGWFFQNASDARARRVNYYNGVADLSNLVTSLGGSTKVEWNGNTNFNTSIEYGPVSGGNASATPSSICSTSNALGSGRAFVDCLNLAHTKPDSHGGGLGFSGPFVSPSDSSPLTVANASGNLSLQFSVLPGAGIGGVGVFIRDGVTNVSNIKDVQEDDGYACNRLAASGFDFIGNRDLTLSDTAVTAQTLTINAADLDNIYGAGGATSIIGQLTSATPTAQILLCPYVASYLPYMNAALTNEQSGGGGGGNASGPASQFTLDFANLTGSNVSLFNGICSMAVIKGFNANGNSARFVTGTVATLSIPAGVTAYTDPMCSYPISGSTLHLQRTDNVFFVRRASSGASSTNPLSVTIPSFSVVNRNLSFTDAAPAGNGTLRVVVAQTVHAHECQSAYFEMRDDNGVPFDINPVSANYVTVDITTKTDLNLYASYDSICENSPNSTNSQTSIGSSGNSVKMFNYRYVGTNSSFNFLPLIVSGTFTGTALTSLVNAVIPGATDALRLNLSTTVGEGICLPVDLDVVDANGFVSPIITETIVDLATTTGGFTTSNGCSAPSTNIQVTFTPGSVSRRIYYKATTSGAGSVTATVNSGETGLIAAQANFTVTPAIADHFAVLSPPGETLNAGAVSGTPQPTFTGMSTSIEVYALKYDGTIDTSFNGTGKLSSITIGGGGAASYPSASSINFINGVANFNITPTAGPISLNVMGATGIYGNSFNNIVVMEMATQFNIYAPMSSPPTPLAFPPNACQILAIIPENNNGYANRNITVSVNLSSDFGGTFYSDHGCTSAITSISFFPTDRAQAVYFKGPTASQTYTLQTSAGGFSSATQTVTTLPSGTVGAVAKWMIVGRPAGIVNTTSSICQPYLVVPTDSTGAFTPVTTNTTVNAVAGVYVGTSGGTYGGYDYHYYCGFSPGANAVSVTTSQPFGLFFLGAMIQGNGTQLQVSGGGLTSGSLNVSH